ncbi:RraA family protein [Pseudonocardia acaciae]|uniref:RraA family protein n=1 Tax=Pseudonocardia acaciae TaxID=551276 RepID=UPI00048D7BDD|nr:RraA family protein [Pseudonocardia acaciae]
MDIIDTPNDLSSALAADALDTLGHRAQCLGPDVRPLTLSQRVVGRAHPVRAVPAEDIAPARPYAGLLAALDVAPPGSVFVFATGRSDAAGVWGELITTASRARGLAGALTDGLIRDVTSVAGSGFPVFSRGATPYDSKGRVDVVEHGRPVVVDGVTIGPGDLVVGDADGVCIVPAALVDDVLDIVRRKRLGENEFREAVAGGMPVSEAFRAFGVL